MKDLETELRRLASRPEAEEADPDTVEGLVQGGIERGRRRSRRAGAAALAISTALLGTALVVQQSGILDPPTTLADHAAVPPQLEKAGSQTLSALASVMPEQMRVEAHPGGFSSSAEVVQRFTVTGDHGTASGELSVTHAPGSPGDEPKGVEHRWGQQGEILAQHVADDGRGGERLVAAVELKYDYVMTMTLWNRKAGAASPVTADQLPLTSSQALVVLDRPDLDKGVEPVLEAMASVRHQQELWDEEHGGPARTPLDEEVFTDAVRKALAPEEVNHFQFNGDNAADFWLPDIRTEAMLQVQAQLVGPTQCSDMSWGTVSCRRIASRDGVGTAVEQEGRWPGLGGGRAATFVHASPRRTTAWGDIGIVTRLSHTPEPQAASLSGRSLEADLDVVRSPALDPLVDSAARQME